MHEHYTSVFIRGKSPRNLRFADDKDLIAGSKELQAVVDRLAASVNTYRTSISTDNNITVVNIVGQVKAEMHLNGEQLEKVQSFKYPEEIFSKDCICRPDIRQRITAAMAPMAMLNKIWGIWSVSFEMKFLAAPIMLYSCES